MKIVTSIVIKSIREAQEKIKLQKKEASTALGSLLGNTNKLFGGFAKKLNPFKK